MGSESHARETFAEATAPRTHSKAEQLAWCARHVPDEHPGFAAVTASALKAIGVPVTPVAIRQRLKATGRDMESLNG